MSAGAEGGTPRVTVITTVLDGARYLDETIRSIVGQTFQDFEYILVDDGSTDATPQILARWSAQDARIRVLTNATNLGQAPSANRALALARGEYVARTDADDLSEPDRLERQVRALDSDPSLALVSMNHRIMRADGRVLRRTHQEAPPPVVAFLLSFGNAVGGHSVVMYRRSAVERAGRYDEEFPVALDYDLWARLSEQGGILVMPDIGMRYRLHDQRISARMAGRQRAIASRVTHRVLSRTLGRDVSDAELDAVTSVWSNVPSGADPRLALALFAEAYRAFVAGAGRDPRLAARVRAEYAGRLVAMAASLAVRGRLAMAARLGAAASGWSAGAAAARALRLAKNALVVLGARLMPLRRA